MAFLDDMKQLGKQIASDLGNTYQAILMQDSGWTREGILPDLTQETAENIAKSQLELEMDNQPAVEKNLEPDRG